VSVVSSLISILWFGAVRPTKGEIDGLRPALAAQLTPDIGLMISPEPFAGVAQVDFLGFAACPASAVQRVSVVEHVTERQRDHR